MYTNSNMLDRWRCIRNRCINIINWMQNKSSFVKSNYITPSTRYYRSFKYTVTQASGFHPNSTTFIDNNRSSVNNTSKTNAPSWKKPSSYSQNKQHKNRNSENIQNAQDLEAFDLKVGYLQTWEKLLSQQQKSKNREEKEQKATSIRVHLPSIIDYEPSNFTSLDPLFLPFDHIQQGIDELNQQLPAPKIEMAQIHHDMVNFKNKIMSELQETQKYGLQQFQKLKKMIRSDKVQCQQVNLRFRRQCMELKDIDESYKNNFQTTKPRLDVLQQQIFSCKPFDLQRNKDLDQQFPQAYF